MGPGTRQPVLVWIGRFAEVSGYGSAARAYLQVCRDAGIPVVAIDSKSVEVVGPSCGIPLVITQGEGGRLIIRAPDQDTPLVVVMHETPPSRERIQVSGRARLVNYTVFETDALPQAWFDHALDFDEIWTASDFNRRTFSDSGVPQWMIHTVPHTLDPALEHSSVEPLELPACKRFVFLSVLSAFNRKDAGGLLRAYCSAFTSSDDVTLLLKVRAGLSQDMIEQHIWGPARPEVDPNDAKLPHIVLLGEDLSDERMWALYKRANAYASLERGKGWDLPAMEAMALGTPVVALNWGGSEAFLNEDNALLIPRGDQLVSADPALVQGHTMYAGHRWATYLPSQAAEALRSLYDDNLLRESLASRAAASIRQTCSGAVVASLIQKRLSALRSSDYRSDTTATLELAPQGCTAHPPAQPDEVHNAQCVQVRREHPPEATRLLAHLREVKRVPLWRPRRKVQHLESMMAAYHSAKGALPTQHPVAAAFERFAIVPRANRLEKLMAYRRLCAEELHLLYAASDMSVHDPFDAYTPGQSLDEWVARRKQLWMQTGGIAPTAEERARLATLRNRFAGQKIVIMGNGPSLRDIDLDAMRGTPTFAANRISLAYDSTAWRPTYYTCLDWRVTPDNYQEINALRGSIFFFPNRFRGLLRTGEDVYWYHSINRTDRWREQFETNATHGVRGLGTVVTAMLQLAWHMGYREFVLVGVDADYTIPPTVQQAGPARFDTGHRLELTSTADDDANHFDPRYFGTGKRWHDPNVDEMVRCFALCRKAIEARGGRIVNATPGGRLEVFDRVNLDEELGVKALRASGASATNAKNPSATQQPLPDRLLVEPRGISSAQPADPNSLLG